MQILGLRGVSIVELSKSLWRAMNENDIFGNAAQLAYYFLLALFPLLIFLASLLGYLPIPNLFERIIGSLARVMPPEALKLIADNLKTIVQSERGGLLSFGILAAIWSASAGISAIIALLNTAYGVKESRPYWRVKLIAIVLTMVTAVLVLIASLLVFFGDYIESWFIARFEIDLVVTILWRLGKWLVSLAALFLALELVYYFGPDVEQEWKWITAGSVMAVAIWLLASFGLSFYVQNFGRYNITYGSLGGVIILMLWFYLSGLMILLGGQLNAVIEHHAVDGKAPGEKVAGEKAIKDRKDRELDRELTPAAD
ncbi:MAG: YihY/virulence factor BrkB family protein [Acidobacteriota bacterium]